MMKKLAEMEDVSEIIQKLELIAKEVLTIKNLRWGTFFFSLYFVV